MNSDLIILLVGMGVLIALSVLWVWHYLFRKMNELDALETNLLIQFEERRDVLPYLLESYRSLEPKCSSFFKKIVTQRAEARNSKAFASIREKERLMDAYLNEFFKETQGNVLLEKDIGWLEARTELQKMEVQLAQSLDRHQELINYLKEKKGRFPTLLFSRLIRRS